MANWRPDGSILMKDGRIIYGDTYIAGRDLVELVPLLAPPAWPFVSGGGGGANGGVSSLRGSAGPQGNPGPQGNQGSVGPQGDQGNQGAAGTGGGILFTSMGNSQMGSNQTRFLGVGTVVFSATEDQVELVVTRAGILQNLSVLPLTNTRGDDTTATVRVNGANTAIVLMIPAGSLAFAQNAVDTAAVAPGDVVSIQFETGGGGGNFRCTASLEINA